MTVSMQGFVNRRLVGALAGLTLAACPLGPALAGNGGAEPAAQAAKAAQPYVRLDVRAYLEQLKANPRPAMTREFVAMSRKAPPEMMTSERMGDRPLGDLAEVRDLTMPGPGGPIALRLFDPRPAAEREPGPVVVFYHGGAFVVGSIQTHASLAAEIARQLDLPVVSVEYRLAPENPFPAAADDAEAAARWIAANGAAFDREFNALVVAGDSAGGNLSAVTAIALRDKPATLPLRLNIALYPATDRGGRYESATRFDKAYGLDLAAIEESDFYKGDTQSWRYRPLLADLTGVAPTVVVTAGLDPLRDEGRAYAAKLVSSEVPTAFYEAQGNIHGFATFRQAIPSAQLDLSRALSLARTLLEEQWLPNQD